MPPLCHFKHEAIWRYPHFNLGVIGWPVDADSEPKGPHAPREEHRRHPADAQAAALQAILAAHGRPAAEVPAGADAATSPRAAPEFRSCSWT